jgi:hypothetical protein
LTLFGMVPHHHASTHCISQVEDKHRQDFRFFASRVS